MGLNAVVYKNFLNVGDNLKAKVILVDSETGELEFSGCEAPQALPGNTLVATAVSLGNVSMIGWLSEEIRSRCGEGSLLLESVFYNGSHSGDFISLGRLPLLEQELEAVAALEDVLPSELAYFLESMLRLTSSAKAESNPIIFV